MLDKCKEEGHIFTWISEDIDARPPSGEYPWAGGGVRGRSEPDGNWEVVEEVVYGVCGEHRVPFEDCQCLW